MDLTATAFDIEPRPDGVHLQFVDEAGNRVQVTIPYDQYERFRQMANRTANHLVRREAMAQWPDRAANYKPPRSPWGKR